MQTLWKDGMLALLLDCFPPYWPIWVLLLLVLHCLLQKSKQEWTRLIDIHWLHTIPHVYSYIYVHQHAQPLSFEEETLLSGRVTVLEITSSLQRCYVKKQKDLLQALFLLEGILGNCLESLIHIDSLFGTNK